MHLSLNDAWDDTQAFVRREAGLLLPPAFATLGVALLIYELILPDGKPGELPAGPWMWGLVPVLLLFILGCIAISALVVLPRLSVSDALRIGLARIGQALLLMIGFTAVSGVVLLLLSLVTGVVGGALGWGLRRSSIMAVTLALPLLIWVSVRLLPIWPMLAERGAEERIAALVRRCLALTRGVFWRLLASILLFMVASLLITSAIQFAFGSMLLLLGKIFGDPALGKLLTSVLMALVGASVQTVWIVYIAMIYRRMAAIRGT